jgi:hypothetical protein
MWACENGRAFALDDGCTLSMVEECLRSEDAAVPESNDCSESQRICCGWPGIGCRERENGSWRCALLPWGAAAGGLRRVIAVSVGMFWLTVCVAIRALVVASSSHLRVISRSHDNVVRAGARNIGQAHSPA